MKKWFMLLLLVLAGSFAGSPYLFAQTNGNATMKQDETSTKQDQAAATNDEAADDLQKEESKVDQAAQTPQGEKIVTERLKNQFQVDDQRIQQMRDQKMGWGKVAKELNLNVGKAVA